MHAFNSVVICLCVCVCVFMIFHRSTTDSFSFIKWLQGQILAYISTKLWCGYCSNTSDNLLLLLPPKRKFWYIANLKESYIWCIMAHSNQWIDMYIFNMGYNSAINKANIKRKDTKGKDPDLNFSIWIMYCH